jgi:hypothetical protein
VSQTRKVPAADFFDLLHSFEREAFRLELQDSYAVPEEDELYPAFLRGERPQPTDLSPELGEWFQRVSEHTQQGKRIERVRVQQDPPTDYQRFERWLDRWNLKAGEVMRYLTQRQAHEIGLLPEVGSVDWWLLDNERMILIHFDGQGHPIRYELTTDSATVELARSWRDLAVRHSVRATARGVAA